jgi:5-methyltetrahydropteroyltriglutamate--homocysteine methyltransferase
VAVADAVREEYKLLAGAGFIVQLDDPFLAEEWEVYQPALVLSDYRKWVERRIELLNYSLRSIPAEMVRLHVCWGSWHGPHAHDLPLKALVDLMLKVNTQAYSIEAANPQHEHEWEVWRETKLPDGKILIPGVVTHKSYVIEHPDLVAQRLVRFANLVGRENVIAAPDCGLGGRIHEQLGWAKLKAMVEGARRASAQLWC